VNPNKIPSNGFIVFCDSAGHDEFQKKKYQWIGPREEG